MILEARPIEEELTPRGARLTRLAQTLFVLGVQTAFALCLAWMTDSLLMLICAGLSGALIAVQVHLRPSASPKHPKHAGHARQPRAASGTEPKTQVLFPTFLVNQTLPSGLALLAMALTPFLTCMLLGEPLGQRYPDSGHNNLVSLVVNVAAMASLAGLLLFMRQVPALRAIAVGGYPNQNLYNAVLLDLCLLLMAIFGLSNSSSTVNDIYPLHWLHDVFNSLVLFVCSYLILATTACFARFLHHPRADAVARGGLPGQSQAADFPLLPQRTVLLTTPFIIWALSFGLVSEPGDASFNIFILLVPMAILLNVEVTHLLASAGLLRLVPRQRFVIPASALVGLLSFSLYTTILAYKLAMPYLFAPAVLIWTVFAVLFLATSIHTSRKRSVLVKKIGKLARVEPGSRSLEWFDERVRSYHQLRNLP